MSINSNDILESTKISMEYIQHIRLAIDKLKNGEKNTCLLIVRYVEKSMICDHKYTAVNDNIYMDDLTIH